MTASRPVHAKAPVGGAFGTGTTKTKAPRRDGPARPEARSWRSRRRAEEREKKAQKLREEAKRLAEAKLELPDDDDSLERTELTPSLATQLLELNTLNRPLNDQHVIRIARQIVERKWKYNGDTIKISENHEVLDGQHRLWAIIEAGIAVDTIIVYGIQRDAFATIDTIRKPRSGGDTLALNGVKTYRQVCAGALSWLLRYQKGCIETYRQPEYRIENSDIEAAWQAHPMMARAVEQTMKARRVANPAITGFAYYVMHNQCEAIADQFIRILIDPTATPIKHPFFHLRGYFTAQRDRGPKDPVMSIALIFKAANAVKQKKDMHILAWRNQGARPEPFPKLELV